ncbi:MAG: class I tRNA ligase family protein, partial [Candidatus Hermodarchaeota archaeon]
WTTTPWTLIGNVALAVNGQETYVKIQIKGSNEFFILMKSRLVTINEEYEIVREFLGEELLFKEYEALYPLQIDSEKIGYKVIDGGVNVLSTEGTGIIHLAIYGEFDFEMIEKYDLPIVQHLDERGKLVLGPKEWKDTWFKDLDALISDDLNARSLLYREEEYYHSYPFCYRCETPLIYNALDAWFIKIQEIKPKLLKTNQKINWYPREISKRYENIISTAPDWCISRNRFWATAIPIWECQRCGHIEVIGSIKELKERSIEKVQGNLDLHRHIIDKIHLRCPNCGEVMSRIPEVFDCWLESGSMPYASKHYPFENVEWFKQNFPSDFVSEYVGQVRAWFYYMHVVSTLLFNEIPFKNVIVNGNILAEDGTKMSKSKRNYPDPNEIIKKFGADALRMYLMSSQLMRAQDLNFKEEIVKQVFRRFNLLLMNIIKFYRLIDNDTVELVDKKSTDVLDLWLISILNVLIRDITEKMDDYNTAEASRLLFNFIEELSTWYLRNSRNRFKSNNKREKQEAMQSFSYVLLQTSRLLAPLAPFISEMLYQALKEKHIANLESIHLESWPKYNKTLINIDIQNKMDITKELVKKALELRDIAKIPIRQVLSKAVIKGINLDEAFLNIIADAVNLKSVELKKQEEGQPIIDLDTEITKELRLEGIARTLIRHINKFRKDLGLSIKNRIILYLEVSNEEINDSIREYRAEIMEMTQSDSIVLNSEITIDYKSTIINNIPIGISINPKKINS